MDKIICNHCHAENPSEKHFCQKCGAFLRQNEFARDIVELPELKMMRVVDNLITLPHQPVNWDDLTDGYARKVEKFKALYNIPELGKDTNADAAAKLDDFLNRCRNPEFQIAFVGTIKTGKSTLINALLGKNYASMDVTPETAALTKFRASLRDYVKLTFYTRKEWKELMSSRTIRDAEKFMEEYRELNAEAHVDEFVGRPELYREVPNEDIEKELAIWSSSKRPEHYFVKEIEVGISTLGKDFPAQVVFVDTPGLSDPVQYRSELTRQYIRRANAVFVCVDAQKVYHEEVKTITSVFAFSANNKSKVHIIATHWDVLNDPESDWRKQKEYLIKLFVGPEFFESKMMAFANIMPSAAFLYNLCRDYNFLSKAESRPLRKFALNYDYELPDDLDKIKEKTNIDAIMRVIKDKLVHDYKKLMLEDIKFRYNDAVYTLRRITEGVQESARENLESSYLDGEQLQQRLKEKEAKRDNVKQVSDQLNGIIKKVRQKTQARAGEICGKLRLKIVESKK